MTAHAGEEGPASYIEEAVDMLHAERIDHGIAITTDDALLKRLAAEQVPFTVWYGVACAPFCTSLSLLMLVQKPAFKCRTWSCA